MNNYIIVYNEYKRRVVIFVREICDIIEHFHRDESGNAYQCIKLVDGRQIFTDETLDSLLEKIDPTFDNDNIYDRIEDLINEKSEDLNNLILAKMAELGENDNAKFDELEKKLISYVDSKHSLNNFQAVSKHGASINFGNKSNK